MGQWKRRREEEGSERREEDKKMRVREGKGDEEQLLTEPRIKRIVWKLKGKAHGVTRMADAAEAEESDATVVTDGSCSRGSDPSVSKSTSISSSIVNEQRRQPRVMPPRGGHRLALLPMAARDNNPVCVLQKSIAYSDVNCKQHRLLLPKDQLKKAALEGLMTAAEKMRTTQKSGLPIRILDREGREYNLILKFVASIKTYRIMGADYMKLVDDNQFQTGHFLDLWVYRVGQRGSGGDNGIAVGELRMATINHKKAEQEEEEENVEIAADDRGCASADEPASTGGGGDSIGEEKAAAAAHAREGDADVLAAWTLVALARGSRLQDIVVL